MENRVRMIVDAKADGVDVVHGGELPRGVSLAHCTLRMVGARGQSCSCAAAATALPPSQ